MSSGDTSARIEIDDESLPGLFGQDGDSPAKYLLTWQRQILKRRADLDREQDELLHHALNLIEKKLDP